jgi:hypothetical protein
MCKPSSYSRYWYSSLAETLASSFPSEGVQATLFPDWYSKTREFPGLFYFHLLKSVTVNPI